MPAGPGPGSAGGDRLRVADQLPVQQGLALLLADGDDLVALAQDAVRPKRGRDAAADHGEQRAALRHVELIRRTSDGRGTGLEMGFDDLELTLAERGQVQQLVDRDV